MRRETEAARLYPPRAPRFRATAAGLPPASPGSARARPLPQGRVYAGAVSLSEDGGRIAEVAAGYAAPEEEVAAVLPVEPASGERVYLCAFVQPDGTQSWLAFD